MVFTLGPQPRFLNFFAAISEVAGVPQEENQEMILRKIWVCGLGAGVVDPLSAPGESTCPAYFTPLRCQSVGGHDSCSHTTH